MAQKQLRPRAPKGTRPIGGKRSGSGRWGTGHLRCHTCQHTERGRIDYLLATGATQSAVAEQFGLGRQNLGVHYKNHVTSRFKAMAKAQHSETFEKLLKDA